MLRRHGLGPCPDRPCGIRPAAPRGRRTRVDVILVADVSRLSRDLTDAALFLRECLGADVTIIGVADGVDTSSREALLSQPLSESRR